MFTLHFILLLGFSTLQLCSAQNTEPKLVNLQSDSGVISTSGVSPTSSLTQSLGNEFSEDYDGEEFQDNRLRLMLQPKKPLTLNKTKLRTWPVYPNIPNDGPIISYRNSFGGKEIYGNEITENTSANKQGNSNNYRTATATILPKINSTTGETPISLNNKTRPIVANSEQGLNSRNLSSNTETAKFEANPKHVNVNLTDITHEEISNLTVVKGKFVASLQSSKNSSSQNEKKTISNSTGTPELNSTPKPDFQNVPNEETEENSEQKEEMEPSISGVNNTGDPNVQESTPLPLNPKNQTQDSESDNSYEELEPDILNEENDIDYITPNETAIDETNTVLIVLPGGDTKQEKQLTEIGPLPGKPYISEAISQNLLHLLMNLTAMTAVNERNGKKILKELQEQKGQLQSLKKQSDNIYSYITRIKNQPK